MSVLKTSSVSHSWAVLVILAACLAGCTYGSCLSYGHSCWGAHGKRAGVPETRTRAVPSYKEWFKPRLALQPVKLPEEPTFNSDDIREIRLADNSADLEDSSQTEYQTNSQSDDNDIIYWKQRSRLPFKPKATYIFRQKPYLAPESEE